MANPLDTVEVPVRSGVSGAVRVFLIADVRGYTEYTHEYGDEAAAQLVTKFAGIARELVAAWDGEVIELRGDEALAVFQSPRQAIRAAVELQERLKRERQTDPALPLKVGMGLDAGEAVPVRGGFRGGALNLAARLCSLASPGEVFVSEELMHLARKIDELVYLDRGQVLLKGLAEPVQVHQVVPKGQVPTHVPKFHIHRTLGTNLPIQFTSFVGRERELVAVTGMLLRDDVRLLTLTGPPGTGKTRLALQAAADVAHAFSDGVFLISLAQVADPDLIPSQIAVTLGLRETVSQAIVETLVEYLGDKQLLLVLDNFEHVLKAAPEIAGLLARCPRLKIVATSRSALNLSAEHQYGVPPLSTPDPKQLPPVEHLHVYDAVTLFTQRARAANADFALTEENALAVAEICQRLDGLPLALELAAARMKLFSPQALLTRLANRMQVLTGGARDLPTRQQTLRSTLEWSYSLLDEKEQRLFRRLSVFSGGCTLEAAEAVCGSELEIDILDGVDSLVGKSLLRPAKQSEGEPRFLMLETLREYAFERLMAGSEAETLQRRHATYFLGLAERAEPEVLGPAQALWLSRLETEHDNLRAALSWALEEREVGIGLRLSGALWRFWQAHGHLSEGYRWIEEFLSAQGADNRIGPSEERSAARAKALMLAGAFATNQGDYDRALRLAEASLVLYQDLADDTGIASALNVLGNIAHFQCAYERAAVLFEESLTLRRRIGNQRDVAMSLNNLASALFEHGDHARAMPLFQESLAIQRALQDTLGVAFALNNLGEIACVQDAHDQAVSLLQESLALRRELGDHGGIAHSLKSLGLVARNKGDAGRAAALYREALALYRQVGDKWGCAACLEGIAGVAGAQGQSERAARLFGAASAIRDAIGAPVATSMRRVYDEDVDAVRAALGDWRFAAAWAEGRTLSLEQTSDEVRSL